VAIFLKALAGETFIVYGRGLGSGLYDATIAACHTAVRVSAILQPTAILNLASRRGDPSPMIRQFLRLVTRSVTNIPRDQR